MPDIEDVRGTLAGTGGVILDGMVKVADAGKWSHRRYEPQGAAPYWTTDVEGVSLPRGHYRLKLRFGDHIADMRGYYNGERFTGEGGATVLFNAAKEPAA